MADVKPTLPPSVPAPPVATPKPLAKPDNPFKYATGLPQWVFDYKPKLPSRNMSIFLLVVTSTVSAYVYDRRQCRLLQQEYVDQVKHLSQEKVQPGDRVRRLNVYGARIPEDGELDRSSKWFKRYMRPIFLAAGLDYTLTTGVNPGGLGRTILAEIRARRLAAAARAASSEPLSVLEERDLVLEAGELAGGIVLLGRGALKEYLWALRKGFNEDIDLVEEGRLEGLGLGAGERRKDGRWEREDELMVQELDRADAASGAGPFDVPETVVTMSDEDASLVLQEQEDAAPTLAGAYAPYRNMAIVPQTPAAPAPAPVLAHPTLPAPAQLPPQPPLLLVPFTHRFGVTQWPIKLLRFFNHRADVRLGGEYALRAIANETRPLENPVQRTETGALAGMLDDVLVAEVRRGEHKDLTMEEGQRTGSRDLDHMFDEEEIPVHFRKSYRTLPSAHEFGRRNYYTVELPPKLATAREIASGSRPLTSTEEKYPPKIESELRKERLEKELRWHRELEGWATRRAGSGLAWDDKWNSADLFKVFKEVGEPEMARLRESKRRWEELDAATESRCNGE